MFHVRRIQIRSLQHLSRFIALGSLILSNNNLSWIELQHIRHLFILDLKLDGNSVLESDPNCNSIKRKIFSSIVFFRSTTCTRLFTESLDVRWSFCFKYILKSLSKYIHIPLFFLATERNQIDEFFTQSSLTQKPVVN